MQYIEAPNQFVVTRETPLSIFVAGGITGCPDWQKQFCELLKDEDVVLLNPRRKDFPINRPSEAKKQIIWEFQHLRLADAIVFWFPHETLCPIVLYELGAWSMTNKKLFVGIDPLYARRADVEIQTSLVRTIPIVYSVEDLAEEARLWLKKESQL